MGVGSNSNVQERGPEAETNRAAVWEVDPKTGAYRVFASGLRNPNGLTFYPGSNTLWTVVNERDELGPNLVPDYMTSVRHGAFYGWPYSYYGQHVDPRVRPQRPDLVAKAIPPDYALSSHVAPLGPRFLHRRRFPAGSAAARSSASTAAGTVRSYNGYKVVFIRFAGGRPVGKPSDFVSGFLDARRAMRAGGPVGVAVDRTGALIIADDVGNTVWRVSYVGTSGPRRPPDRSGGESGLQILDQVDALPRETVAFGLAAEVAVGGRRSIDRLVQAEVRADPRGVRRPSFSILPIAPSIASSPTVPVPCVST